MVTEPRIDGELIRSLLSVDHEHCLSIILPMVVAGPETEQNPIRFKNALKKATIELDDNLPEVFFTNLGRLKELESDYDLWQHASHGMAWFISEKRFQQLSLNHTPPEIVSVGRSFFIRPLFASLDTGQQYQLLTISINEIHLYRGNGDGLHEVALPTDQPWSMDGMLGAADDDATLQAHTSGDAGAVYHDQDEGARSKARIRKYLAVVVNQLDDANLIDDCPLITAGVEFETRLLESASPDHWPFSGQISGNMDHLAPHELHQRAWKIVASVLTERRQVALDGLAELSPDNVAVGPVEVLRNALAGRVDTTYYLPGAEMFGSIDPRTLDVNTDNIRLESGSQAVELLNESLAATVQHGGHVHAVDTGQLDHWNDALIVARLRY